MFDVDNLLGYDTNAYQLIQHVVAACFYLPHQCQWASYAPVSIIQSNKKTLMYYCATYIIELTFLDIN